MLKRRSLTLHLKSIVVFLLVCPSVQSAENETLYLTATINDQPVKGFIKAKNSNNKIYIAAQDMDKLNLKVSSLPEQKGYFDISSQDGLSVTFDNLNQSLIITASKNWLDREAIFPIAIARALSVCPSYHLKCGVWHLTTIYLPAMKTAYKRLQPIASFAPLALAPAFSRPLLTHRSRAATRHKQVLIA